MKRLLPIGILCFWIIGCASHPLPIIENRTYTNPEYAFSIDLPRGWTYDDKPPDWLAKKLPRQQTNSVMVSLSNEKTSGFILISGSQFQYSIDTPEEREEMRETLFHNSEKQKRAFEEKPDHTYHYQMHEIRSGVEPQKVLNEIILSRNEMFKMVIHGSSFLHLCGENRTCGLDIVLISDARMFEENYEVYTQLLETLSAKVLSQLDNPLPE